MKNIDLINSNRYSIWFNQYYILIFCGFLFLFILLAFLAPVFMKIKLDAPANLIYGIYKFFCHQLAFRSWFLFGQQSFYPRIISGINTVKSYESATGDYQLNLEFARNFIGNEKLGYKVALCQRDLAIYSSLLIFGLIYYLSGKRIRPLPWYLWILIGLIPIGLDGVSQFGGLGIDFLSWLPVRESTPLLRTLTGCLFGITTALFIFPLLEENMQEKLKHIEINLPNRKDR